MADNVLGDHSILTCTTATDRPEQVAVFDFVRNKDVALRSDNPRLQDLLRSQSMGARERSMPAALDVSAETDARVLSSGDDSALSQCEVEHIAPVMATSSNNDILGVVSLSGNFPAGLALKLAKVVSPDGESKCTARSGKCQ